MIAAFTNNIETIEIEVEKIWKNADGSTTWPEDLTVDIQLTADGRAVTGQTVTLSADKTSHTFTGLQKYKADGTTEIAYSVEELETAGYTSAVGALTSGKITITNTEKVNPGSLKIKKTVTENGGTPDSAYAKSALAGDYVFTIYKDEACQTPYQVNGQAKTVTLTIGADGAAVTSEEVTGLPAGDYWIKETAPTNGSKPVTNPVKVTVVAGKTGDQAVIAAFTNNIETTQIEVEKIWKNADGSTTWPKDLTVEIQLTADGRAVTGQTAALSADKTSHAFTGLPKYKADGTTEIAYSVEELDAAGYTSVVGALTSGKITITNTEKSVYVTKGEITFSGKKTLENRELKEGEFSFQLYEVTKEGEETKDNKETLKETVTNAADGSYSFSKIAYTEADLDKDAEGHYKKTTKKYKVVEKKGEDDSVNYDTRTYDITVTLEDDGKGTVNTTADPKENTYDFTNIYSASGSIRLAGVKTLIGDKTLEKGMFTFTLTEVSKPDSAGKTSVVKNGIRMETQNAKDGSFSFDQLNYTLADLGTHYYKITETAGAMKGITYDSTEYLITVTVKDINKNGKLSVTADKNLSDISFVNQYQAAGQANLYAKKTLDGKSLKKGQFIFVLKDAQGNVIQRKSNNAGGIAAFSPIYYDRPGTYQYTISEELPEGVNPDQPVKNGISYDTSVHKVTVTVTDDGQGRLNVSYDGADTYAGAAFINSCKAKGSITFSGDKTLKNGNLKDGQFAFEVMDSDGNVIQTVTNNADGTIDFDEIHYTQDDEDIHTYTVREVEPDDDTIVCKTGSYTVTVTVKDQGDGTLQVTASDNAKNLDFVNVQKDSEEEEEDEDEDEDEDEWSSSSKTGDSNNILGYSLMALLALTAAGILFWRRRKDSGK